MRLRSGLSLRSLERRTGIDHARVHRLLSGRGRPRRGEMPALRQAMRDAIRLRRSSDPAFLSAIQRVVVPFLAGRLRGTR